MNYDMTLYENGCLRQQIKREIQHRDSLQDIVDALRKLTETQRKEIERYRVLTAELESEISSLRIELRERYQN